MPTWRPSTSTVVVPSGDAAVIVPDLPGTTSASSRNSSRPGVNSSSSGIRLTVNPPPTSTSRQRHRGRRVVVGAGDRVAVRAGGGVAEHADDGRLDRLGDDVLPLAGLLVGVGPRQLEDVGEEALGEAVAAHHPLGEPLAVLGEADGVVVDGDEALALEPLDHLGHRRARHHEAVGDAGLDDVDVVLVELEDRLAVLLEGGVELRGLVLGHGRHATGDRPG